MFEQGSEEETHNQRATDPSLHSKEQEDLQPTGHGWKAQSSTKSNLST